MKLLLMLLLLSSALQLGGCAHSVELPPAAPPPQQAELPPVPADIEKCFRDASGDEGPPDRDLTAEEVETMWKQDILRPAILRRCGQRFLAWYGNLRRDWK